MSALTRRTGSTAKDRAPGVNEVRLIGRLAAAAEERTLPSGDSLCSFRVVVSRPAEATARQRVDALECTAWSARTRRSALLWRAGDVVEVTGALRRRFFRSSGATGSRVEVEVSSARLVRRAPTA